MLQQFLLCGHAKILLLSAQFRRARV
jgi:hypothetical protein